MGDKMKLEKNSFLIKKENFTSALDALKKLFILVETPDCDTTRRELILSWVNQQEVIAAKTLEDALIAIRYKPIYDQDENICGLDFLGEKLGGENEYFNALALFVENGSYLRFRVEGQGTFTWIFGDNGVELKYD